MLKLFEIPQDVTIWQILNSQFLTTLLTAAFGLLFIRYESRLRAAEAQAKAAEADAKAADEALQAQAAVREKDEDREDAEAILPAQPQVKGRDWRNEARELWQKGRDYIVARVKADGDGRHKRTYDKIPLFYPDALAFSLKERGQITASQFEGGYRLFAIWKRYGRGKAARLLVPESVYLEMKEAYDQLTNTA